MPTLDWIGKKAVENHHNEVPYRLLRCNPELSVGEPGSGNLLVQGDNLEALKALLPYYGGKVKCIYIDPPYNTGNENWVYNDAVNSPEMRQWLGDVVGRDDLSRHDKWLCMMYPRLALLREFLTEDGAIFVSIDDNEVQNLRAIMDEIFGESNFIATVVWQKKQSPQNDAVNLSDMHDYILVYARRAKQSRDDPYGWARNLISREAAQDARYENPDNDPRGAWTSADYTCNKTSDERPNLYYPIKHPHTGKDIWPSRRRVWAFDPAAHQRNVQEKRIWWGSRDTSRPRVKKYLGEVQDGIVPSTWWTRDLAGDNQDARRELRALMHDENIDFQTPKPVRLLKRILEIGTDVHSMVLDSFAGSGSTGHAVFKQNADDGGNRRFILVEMEPSVAREITAERLKRVALGYTNGKGEVVPGLGGGFRFCELGETLFEADGSIRSTVKFADLAAHVFFAEMREPLPAPADGQTPLIGVARGTAVYLLYNGVLKDKDPKGGNVLTTATLRLLPPHDGPKVVYGTACTLGAGTLKRHGVTFRQIPYEVKAS